MIKIYVAGNYLVVDDGVLIMNAHAKDVTVAPISIVGGEVFYSLINFPRLSADRLFPLSKLTDSAGVAYTKTSFETFYQSSTGKVA